MASEFDELVDDLLYQTAIAGEDGLDFGDLETRIRAFYADKYGSDLEEAEQPQGAELLFSDEPPPTKTNVNADFIESIWDWLCRHKDVLVHGRSSSERHAGQTLSTTTERLWQSVAGHGVDLSRIKPTELICLRIIAQHGSSGIIQPDLVRESGQDKRSVPKRTDVLAGNGYIVKVAIVAAGTRTSLLKLSKYADREDDFPVSAGRPGGALIFYDRWFDKVVELLQSNDNVMVMDDIRVGLGIQGQDHETRALNRCLRRLFKTGCMRRLVLTTQVEAQSNGKKTKQQPKESRKNTLQLVRPPTDADRVAFARSQPGTKSDGARKADDKLKQSAMQDNESDEDDEVNSDEDDDTVVNLGLTEDVLQSVPQWTPDLHISNFVFDLLETAGPAGLASMDVHYRGVGPAWRRPIDEIMIRLCDHWQTSQPPHLKHLSILKDVSMRQRTHYFRYRTRAAFEEAVARGDTFWDALEEGKPSSVVENARRQANSPAELDAWGFPLLSPEDFAGKQDGSASLQVCAKAASERIRSNASSLRLKRKTTIGRASFADRRRDVDEIAFEEDERELNDAAEQCEQAPELESHRSVSPGTQLNVSNLLSPVSAPKAAKAKPEYVDDPMALIVFNTRAAVRSKTSLQQTSGRPKKYMIAVFRNLPLANFPWFVPFTESQSGPEKRKRSDFGALPAKRARHMLPEADDEVETVPHEPWPQQELSDIAAEAETGNDGPARLPPTNGELLDLDDSEAPERIKDVKKTAAFRPSGSMAIRRSNVIMDIIHRCGGAFPGNREIHLPASQILKQVAGTTADTATLDNTIKGLVSRGKLRKIVYQFHDIRGLIVRRTLLIEPEIQLDAEIIRQQQKLVEKMHPSKYRPPPVLLENTDDAVGRILQDHHAEAQDKIKQIDEQPGETAKVVMHKPLIDRRVTEDQRSRLRVTLVDPSPDEAGLVVRRTEAGLMDAAMRRARVLDRMQALRPSTTSQVRRVPPRTTIDVGSDDDSDAEGDIDLDQTRNMAQFQLDAYTPHFGHALEPHLAFRSIHPRTAYPSSFTPRAEASLASGMSRAGRAAQSQDVQLPWYTLSSSATHETRGRDMMLVPPQASHTSSGMIGTGSGIGLPASEQPPKTYEFSHHGWVSPQPGRESYARRPGLRLATLAGQSRGLRTIQPRPLPGLQWMTRSQVHVAASHARTTQGLYATQRADAGRLISAKSVEDELTERSIEVIDADAAGPAFRVTRRDRRGPQTFDENDRLANAVALYRAILGGLDGKNNWGIIAHMMSFRYEPDFLRRRWDNMKLAREETVQYATTLAHEPFLHAYERGEIPAIDFSDLSATDWPAIMKWFESTIVLPNVLRRQMQQLPSHTYDFHASYKIVELSSVWEHSRDSWFTTVTEKARKDLAHEYVFGIALPRHIRLTQNTVETSDLVVRSVIRANMIAKPEVWDQLDATRILARFDSIVLARVTAEMLAEKTLRWIKKGRPGPGRIHEIHDQTWSVFRRWPAKEGEYKYLRQVAAAREKLLKTLDDEDSMQLSFHASDYEILVLENMIGQGMLSVSSQLPPRNDHFDAPFPKVSAWGYNGYNYNAKTLAKDRLRFPIIVEKTDDFDTEHGLVPGIVVPLGPAPRSKHDDGRIPFWVDIHGNLVPEIWEMVLRSVLHVVIFRTGLTVGAVAESHAHRLLTWEIDLVLEWMRQSCIAEAVGPGKVEHGFWTGGWRASEWWYCIFASDMVTWGVRS